MICSKGFKFGLGLVLLGLTVSCGSSNGIFPPVVTSTAETEVSFPNPAEIVIDQARGQIVVVNSNVDVYFEQGSLAVLSVDASNQGSPNLTTQQVIAAPNYAGRAYSDGTSIYIPFREESTADPLKDQFVKYDLQASSVAVNTTATVAANPFGIDSDGTNLYVVSDDALGIYDPSLNLLSQIDLTGAEATIEESEAEFVESVAVDAGRNKAFVTNSGGRIFIIDLANDRLSQVLSAPESSRDVIVGTDRLYVLDPLDQLVWIYDLTRLPAPTNEPELLDDSDFVLGVVGVGFNSGGMALDEATNRLYVANTSDDSLSVIDTSSLQEVARLPLTEDDVPEFFQRGCVDPFAVQVGTFNTRQYIFVACLSSQAVLMIDAINLNVVEVYPNTDPDA